MVHRKMPGVRRASAKEVRELLKLGWVRDEALSAGAGSGDARLLPDGRVLLYGGERVGGTIYPSRAALEQMQRECEEMMKTPLPGAGTLLPPIDDFLRDVEAHAKSVGKALRVPDDALDFSEGSLRLVDAALARVRPAARRLTPEIVTPLTAYVGEVMRRGCDGVWAKFPTIEKKAVPVFDPTELAAWQETYKTTWEAVGHNPADVRFGQLTLTHPKPIRYNVIELPLLGHEDEPAIRARDGQLLQPFALVFVPMVEPSKRVLLRAAVDVMLLPYRSRNTAHGAS